MHPKTGDEALVYTEVGMSYYDLNLWVILYEYKSDLEDKLQTYNKINGAIRRHFGKQMNKETKLIHNITAKAAVKPGCWRKERNNV